MALVRENSPLFVNIGQEKLKPYAPTQNPFTKAGLGFVRGLFGDKAADKAESLNNRLSFRLPKTITEPFSKLFPSLDEQIADKVVNENKTPQQARAETQEEYMLNSAIGAVGSVENVAKGKPLVDKATKSLVSKGKAIVDDLAEQAKQFKTPQEFIKNRFTPIENFSSGTPGSFWSPKGSNYADYGNIKTNAFVDESKIFKPKQESSYDFLKVLYGENTPVFDSNKYGVSTLGELDELAGMGMPKQITYNGKTINTPEFMQKDPNWDYRLRQELVRDILKDNWDGIYFSYEDDLSPKQYYIWNKDKALKTKPELTDIWNKANLKGGQSTAKELPAALPKNLFQPQMPLTTKLLEQFRGLPTEIKPARFEEIINKSKKLGIKQVDEQVVRSSLVVENGLVNLPKTAAKIEEQLVPLTATPVKSPRWSGVGQDFIGEGRYGEIVYQSPIETSAGDVHFRTQGIPGGLGSYDIANQQPFPNYFSHIRYEDLADGKTRKIIETQSDLMQKENFVSELNTVRRDGGASVIKKRLAQKAKELAPLRNYESNDPLAHLRTFREEVKRAAKDGKDTLLTPSGETAMRIEGLGESSMGQWTTRIRNNDVDLSWGGGGASMKEGLEISNRTGNTWIITDVLGDGKFRAVPKDVFEMVEKYDFFKETFDISGKVDTKHFVYKLNENAIPQEARKQGLIVEGKIDLDNGSWWQIRIPKERAKMPVEAFGVLPLAGVPLMGEQSQEQNQSVFKTNQSKEPLFIQR